MVSAHWWSDRWGVEVPRLRRAEAAVGVCSLVDVLLMIKRVLQVSWAWVGSSEVKSLYCFPGGPGSAPAPIPMVAHIACSSRFGKVLTSLAFVVTRTPMHSPTQRHKDIVRNTKT